MRGSLILRLVDITLLLLLSLMAATSVRPDQVDPPGSERLQDRGALERPLRVVVTAQGRYRMVGEEEALTLEELAVLLEGARRSVELIADRRAHARVLLEAHQVTQDAGATAVFLVQRMAPQGS